MTDTLKKSKILRTGMVACLVAPLALGACSYINKAPVGYTLGHPDPLVPPSYEPIFGKWPGSRADGTNGSAAGMGGENGTGAPNGRAGAGGRVLAEAMGDMTGGDWQDAAKDLVNRVMRDLGRPTEGVWLQPDEGQPIAPFENALRSAFEARRVHVAENPGDVPFQAAYSAESGLPGHTTVRLVLRSGRKDAMSENGVYGGPGAPSSPPSAAAPIPESMTPMGGAMAPPVGLTGEPGGYGYSNP